MKSIEELDHYELLEIPPAATQGEIDRAYRLAQQTYADGSLALYSVFENIDAEAIRARLDYAYQTLSDAESRDAYDREFHFDRDASNETFSPGSPGSPGSAGSKQEVSGAFDELASAASASVLAEGDEGHFETYSDETETYDAFDEEAGGDYDGVRLRRARLFRGYEIDDISDVTKVSGAHLRNIEEENFHALPANVYVRGFVTAYAKTIGLDPKIVVPGYMARVEESREGGRRGRFLGRR